MNKCIMFGRLTRDVELRKNDDKSVARFGIAVNRRYKNAEGNYDADFINCVAFNGLADFVGKYFSKGSMIAIVGRWTTGSYTNNDGVKVYTNELIVEEVHFAGGKNSEQTNSGEEGVTTEEGAPLESVDFPVANEDDLPF